MCEFEQDRLTDEELVFLSQQGDENAKDELCRRYREFVRVKTRPYFLIGADRDDILQEGMIGLYKAIRDYNPEHSTRFLEFASICINRHVFSVIKKASSLKHMPLNSYISLYTPVSEEDKDMQLIDTIVGNGFISPEGQLESAEFMDGFCTTAKMALTDLEFNVMQLFLSGKSYKDIAAELGCETKTVDNALQRIRRKFQKLAADGEINSNV